MLCYDGNAHAAGGDQLNIVITFVSIVASSIKARHTLWVTALRLSLSRKHEGGRVTTRARKKCRRPRTPKHAYNTLHRQNRATKRV